MVQTNCHRSIGFLDVSIIDRDLDFLTMMVDNLELLGVGTIHCGSAVKYADRLVQRPRADIIFLEFTRHYLSAWEYIKAGNSLQTVVVGMTQRRDSREYLSAINSGAERVLAKNQASTIVEPMLMHLLGSDMAKRFRVVALPETCSS